MSWVLQIAVASGSPAFGVPDEEFGERLRAFVVLRPGQRLVPGR
jgi:hypothetical protein